MLSVKIHVLISRPLSNLNNFMFEIYYCLIISTKK